MWRLKSMPAVLLLLLFARSAAAQTTWPGFPAKCSASTATGAQTSCGTLDACVTIGGCVPKFTSVRAPRGALEPHIPVPRRNIPFFFASDLAPSCRRCPPSSASFQTLRPRISQ